MATLAWPPATPLRVCGAALKHSVVNLFGEKVKYSRRPQPSAVITLRGGDSRCHNTVLKMTSEAGLKANCEKKIPETN